VKDVKDVKPANNVKRLTLLSGEKSFPLEVGEGEGRLRVSLSGKPLEFDLGDQREGGLSIIIEGRSYEARVAIHGNHISVEIDGERHVFELDDLDRGPDSSARSGGRSRQGSAEVVAPMPGKVVKLLAEPGAQLQADQGVLLFEAMKMQNEIRSPVAGTLVAFDVREGDAVELRDRLFTVKAGEP
jgi:biotin carboxyl carrier protein